MMLYITCNMQAMMKDPFGNYVVQKVLETCDDRSLELILSRIKVHLNALKRYTYGKHIVSRVEKLITTGGKECIADSFHGIKFFHFLPVNCLDFLISPSFCRKAHWVVGLISYILKHPNLSLDDKGVIKVFLLYS